MDVNLVNPFIHATVTVLETMASTKANPGKPFLKKDKIARGDVTGIIGITGEATGTISVTFDQGSILGIVSKMFGEPLTEINAEIADAVGELTNMISGQARRKLEEIGRQYEAAIPSVVTGKDHEINHITSGPIVAVPFTTDGGKFTIEICIET
jgi:chemotaxis protein CheX